MTPSESRSLVCFVQIAHPLSMQATPSITPFTPAGGSLHFPSTSPLPAVPTPAAAAAAPSRAASSHLSSVHFGASLFPGPYAARVVPHFPTAASELADAGLARSAQILLEMSMTFYAAGLAQPGLTEANSRQASMYKPTPLEASMHPPPGQQHTCTRCKQKKTCGRRAVCH